MINRYNNKRSNRERFARCNYVRGSIIVENNVTLSPAQMYGLALQGKPISSFHLPDENFDDGIKAEADEIHVPAHEMRGVDVNDLYQQYKEFHQKVKYGRNKKQRKVVNNKKDE